ncbi:MAG: phospho-sugar mutase [Halobacteriovoraceae bacterium]|nr:phospho-sugar mutase [Halobacteriovoraceae bacterium]
MNKNAYDLAHLWVNSSIISEEDKAEIQKLIDLKDDKEIEERFYKQLEFGTGGLRSILGMGLNRMNKYNVRKATQAMANVIKRTFPSEVNSVAISYDSRNYSFEFAKEVCSVLSGNGIVSYIFERMNPVALLSFSVRHHNSKAGIMITASHNPPEYNGFKAFWSDGAQVTPPYDKYIIDEFNKIQDYSEISFKDFNEGVTEKSIIWVGEAVEDVYFASLEKWHVNPQLCQEFGPQLKIVYTPIHGTGLIPCKRILEDLGFSNLHIVEEQSLPDGSFPTVKSPNPENPEALELAVKKMKEIDADIVMGSDPDTDRLGVAFRNDGEVIYLNGNQIGILMIHYILTNLKEQNRLPLNPYYVKTIVTSELQTTIAQKFGVEVYNTLTGFKWICGKMNEIEKTNPEKNFLFGTEESFGYLNHNNVRDKDGVSSLALMAEIALWYKRQNLNLLQGLDKIYEEYGFSSEKLLTLDYLGKEGAEKIQRIMEYFRTFKSNEICGDKISKLSDYQQQKSINFTNSKSESLDLPKSNVLGFTFTSGDKLFLRPSGTEPKIKFYLLFQDKVGKLEEKKKRTNQKIDKFLAYLKDTVKEL